MSNTLTGLIPVIYEALDTVAREQQGFIPSVQKDATAETAAVGQTVRSPVVPAATAADIVPGVTAPNTGSNTFNYVDLQLTKARSVPVQWTGEEQKSVSGIYATLVRDQFAQAFRTLSNEVENDLAGAAYVGASRAVGTAGTTPFGTAGDLSDFAGVQQVLDDNGAPSGDRSLVISSASMANIRGKQSVLFKANEAGTDELLRQGIVARVEGLDLHTSRYAASNAKGTGSGYLVNGALASGASAVAADTGTGTILAGNVVTFAGDSNKYVVGSALSGGNFSLNLPGLQGAVADNAAISLGNNYVANVAFHKSAIVLASRAPAMPMGGDAATDVVMVTDPNSGITFQIAMYKMYRQIHIEIGLVWGVKVVKSEFIATLLG